MNTKRIIVSTLVSIMVTISIPFVAYAQDSTPSATPTKQPAKTQGDKIQDLKERLATKVAQLRDNQRSSRAGTINNKNDETLVLITPKTPITVSFDPTDTTIEELVGAKTEGRTVANLKNDLYISVYGLLDPEANTMDANYILLKPRRMTVVGAISEIDSANFTFTVKTGGNELFTVDYERNTQLSSWNGTEVAKSGFSQIASGDQVHVRAIVQSGEEKKVSATRIIHIPLSQFEHAPTSSPSATL